MTLAPADLAMFARFQVPPGLLGRARVQRVTDHEARTGFGVTCKGPCDGLVFPYLSPVTGSRVACRVRRDHPELDPEGQPLNKYVTAYGDRPHLYFAPNGAVRDARLTDTSYTVVLVEAEKSALTVQALAERTGQSWLPIATGGCWGWRGSRGIAIDAEGQRVEERGPLPDLDHVTWSDRDVVIAFDSNAATNPKVQAARRALAEELRKRGARVRIAEMPVEDGINGPDDLVAVHGDQALRTVLTDARSANVVLDTKPASRPNPATALVQLADDAGAEFFASPDGTAYVSLRADGHRETYPVRSRFTKDWLSMLSYRHGPGVPRAQVVSDALATLAGRARWDGETIPVHVRVATHESGIYIDLGTRSWEVIHVDADGWRLTSESPVRFRRPYGFEALPIPSLEGDIRLLRRFVNVGSDDDYQLLVAWLVAAYRGAGPYPVLGFTGEQGSAKSFTSAMLRDVVDPNATALRAVPRDERDLFITASNSLVIALDNVSTIPDWLSDGLCRLASGIGFSTRALYSDADEVLFTGARPILLNGITDTVHRGDLLDRLVAVNVPTIPEKDRIDEKRLRREYSQVRAGIVGALLTGVSTAIRRLPEVHLSETPRMADFALWVAAAEAGFNFTKTVAIYLTNRQANTETLLSTDALARAVRTFAEDRDEECWEGEYGVLLEKLTSKVPERISRDRQAWPQSERALSGRLRRLAPQLRKVGVNLVFDLRDPLTNNRLLRIVQTVRTVSDFDGPNDPNGSNGSSPLSDRDGPEVSAL